MARAAAAESALTLCTVPSTSGATLETTGIRPASMMSTHRLGADVYDLAHETEVDLLAVDDGVGLPGGEQPGVLAGQADRERAVLVDQPDQLALHLADEHHADDVHRLGRGDPQPATNSDSMPSLSSIREICGPPPCTMTGLKPANRRNAMSSAKARLRTSSVMALPPYFTTTILPWYCFSHGRAAARVAGLGLVRLAGVELAARDAAVVAVHEEYALFSWT